MIRPLEPRVGENRPVEVMKREAKAFLKEMSKEGLFPSAEDFEQRLVEVMAEIDANIVECMVWEDYSENGEIQRREVQGVSSNGYRQNRQELEFGVRVAWRNSRKCIMRAHCWDLKCIDLRDVKTSKGMVEAIIKHAPAAYNDGRIIPTGKLRFRTFASQETDSWKVFIFPARRVDSTAAMFWSQQFLSFAGVSTLIHASAL